MSERVTDAFRVGSVLSRSGAGCVNEFAFMGVDWLGEGGRAIFLNFNAHHEDALHGFFVLNALFFVGDLGIKFHAHVVQLGGRVLRIWVRKSLGENFEGEKRWSWGLTAIAVHTCANVWWNAVG